MYFNKKNCPSCNNDYDEMVDYCPFCHKRNESHLDFKKKHPLFFIDTSRELMLFFLGLIGLSVFALLGSLIFTYFPIEKSLASLIINVSSYLLFFIVAILIIYPYLKNLLDYLKKWDTYIFGVIGAGLLIGGSIGINLLMRYLVPGTGESGNQGALITMVKAYPVVVILVFGIIGPICEELAYRVGLFTLLRRVHPVLAYTLTIIIFAFIHFDFMSSNIVNEFANLPGYIWGAVILSALYDYKGITSSITAHILNNIISFIMILFVA